MTNVDEQRDEERRDPSEAGPADVQEVAETAETDASLGASGAVDSAPPQDEPEVVATAAVVDVDAAGSDSAEQTPAPIAPVEVSDDDVVAIDETSSSDEASQGETEDESEDEARVDPVAAMEQRGHHIGIELKHVEDEVRTLLQDRDPKRKRKLTGNARWHELEDDLIALRFTGRIDESTLARIRQLIARRRYLFSQLAFVAGTRPTWTT